MSRVSLFLFLALVSCTSVLAQPYVEVLPGTYPLILSAPHGGYLEPDGLKDRTCSACVTVRDSRTQEWARYLSDEVLALTGHRPHVVINLLARTKLDANREVVEAADGDPNAAEAWTTYHDALEAAREAVESAYGAGLLLDLHGHGHAVNRFELGYLLSASALRESTLQPRAHLVSVAALGARTGGVDALVRGANSLGALLESVGIPAVPSPADPAPLVGEAFFSGGYITARHGSRDGGSVDAIQLEAYRPGARDSDANVALLASKVAQAVVEFMDHWYGPAGTYTVPGVHQRPEACDAYSGPGWVEWDARCGTGPSVLYDALGRRLRVSRRTRMDTGGLTSGVYFLVREGLPARAVVLR